MSAPRLLSNRYELGETLGYGGMSEVHHGTDIRLGREVAVKILRADLARDPQFQERFRREAQNAAALNHPAIVAVYDTGEAQTEYGPLPYIVMEYVKGRTLRDIVKTEGPLSEKRAMEVMADVCAALDFSHRHAIVHRDVKPANIMITDQGAVKVMDFGIARAMHDGQASMTQTAAVIGTAQYLSPEQARGEGVDARSDVYAAGCVLYELLTGEPPFTGDSPVAVAYQHVREDPKAPSTVNPAVSPALDAIVLKALAKGPANRYQSAAEMRSDMVRVLSGQRPSAPMVMTADERTQVLNGGGPPGHAADYDDYGGPYADEESPKKSRKRKVLTAVLVSVVGVGLVAFVAWLAGAFETKQATAQIPRVKDMTAIEAENQLRNAGFTPVKETVECIGSFDNQPTCNNPDQVNKALRTNPGEGTTAAQGTKVTLYVGVQPGNVAVPDLSGLSQDEAAQRLKDVKLNLNPVVQQVDDDNPNNYGKVLRQNPAPNAQVQRGGQVTITIAKTKNLVQIVDHTGEQFASASAALAAQGLTVKKTSQASDQPEGQVVKQTPNGGAVPEGSTVTLIVSDGTQQKITMPNLVGLTQNDALAQLRAAGWDGDVDYQTTRVADPRQVGIVQSTSPTANTQITKNQNITLFLGSFNQISSSSSSPTSSSRNGPGFP
ncbi:MAG TPA: Stk1 family PASTA domain-containing Ser/Thr kinase [Amycolatopsis sp.]|uniref:Stk1 family PASTA domain-containing Ser/Thr kinase n=1 Tax=Amycolatopsis sp. TaxID=37632 RepID=UPI002B48F538|nr:Stk1 family PASTA domain-containing Ser/Thr kinase [Amycolatopsis sp.]HKS46639.1 Stk1 family PASTA domain-containing Ser/Thr kinase [Amycolatopsis sp.]